MLKTKQEENEKLIIDYQFIRYQAIGKHASNMFIFFCKYWAELLKYNKELAMSQGMEHFFSPSLSNSELPLSVSLNIVVRAVHLKGWN